MAKIQYGVKPDIFKITWPRTWMARTIRIPCSLSMNSTPGAGTTGLAKLHTTSCGLAVSHPGRRHTRFRLSPDRGALKTRRGTAMGLSATGAATLIGVGPPTGILDNNTVICDRRFVTSSRNPVR